MVIHHIDNEQFRVFLQSVEIRTPVTQDKPVATSNKLIAITEEVAPAVVKGNTNNQKTDITGKYRLLILATK